MVSRIYIFLYLLQTVQLQDSDSVISDKENTLFPKNGPVFMRRVYNYDEPKRYTEATVEFFNGTFSDHVWRIVAVTTVEVPTTTTTTTTTTETTNPLEVLEYDEFYNLLNSAKSSSDVTSSNDDFSVDTSTDSMHSALDSSVAAITNEYDLITSNTETTSDSIIEMIYKKNILRSGRDSSVPSDVYTETSDPSLGTTYSSIITTPSTPSTSDTLYPISGAIERHIKPEAFLKLPLSEVVFTPQKIMRPELNEEPKAIQSTEVPTEDFMREDDFTTEKEQRSDKINVKSNVPVYLRPEDAMRAGKETTETISEEPTTTQDDTAKGPDDLAKTANEPVGIRSDDFAREPNSIIRDEPKSNASELNYETTTKFEPIPENIQTTNLATKDFQAVTNVEEIEQETYPFSMFLEKLLTVLASKNARELPNLIKPLERVVDSGKLMKLGTATSAYIAQVLPVLKTPIRDLQRQMFVAKVSLQYRQQMLSEDVNAILSEMDDVYDFNEEEAMQRVLREVELFPSIAKTGDDVVKGFIDDVFIHPMHRIAGTAKGKVIFEHISRTASKYVKPIAMSIARRFESNENKMASITLQREPFSPDIVSSLSHTTLVGKGQNNSEEHGELHDVTKPSTDKSVYVHHSKNDDETNSQDKPLIVEILVKDRPRKTRKRVNVSQSEVSNGRRYRTKIFDLAKGRSRRKGVNIQIKISNSR